MLKLEVRQLSAFEPIFIVNLGSLVGYFLSLLTQIKKLLYNPPLSNAGVAQSVEQLICNQSVIGSIPIAGSTLLMCEIIRI